MNFSKFDREEYIFVERKLFHRLKDEVKISNYFCFEV